MDVNQVQPSLEPEKDHSPLFFCILLQKISLKNLHTFAKNVDFLEIMLHHILLNTVGPLRSK